MFFSPSFFEKLAIAAQTSVCLCSIFTAVCVTLFLWHWWKTVDWVWEQCWSFCRRYGWK